MVGNGVAGAHHAIDHPGLTSDLGGEPTCEDRYQAGGAHQHRKTQEEPRFEQAPTPARPGAPEPEQQHEKSKSGHDPEGPEHDRGIRPILRREILQPAYLPVPAVGQDHAAKMRDLDRIAGRLGRHVGPAEEDERYALVGLVLPMALDGGDLRRLILEVHEAMSVADRYLQRRNHENQPHRHRQHGPHCRRAPALEQVPGTRCADEQGRREIGCDRHVGEPIGKGGVEDHLDPIDRHDAPVDDLEALRRLHPAIGRENPRGGDERSNRHHRRGEEMQTRSDLVPTEEHDAEKTGLEKEGGQDFIGEQRADDASGRRREVAPIGPELIGHHQPRDDTHREVDGEDL